MIRIALITAGLLLSGAGLAQTPPEPPAPGADPEAGALLKTAIDGVQAFYEGKSGVQARFTQTIRRRYRPGTGAIGTHSGTAWFLKPGKMRWDYQTPDPVYYISDGETLWVYEVNENIAYRGRVRGSRLYDSLKFLFGEGRLDEEFDVALGETTNDEVTLVLTPKGGEQAFKRLDLVVERNRWEIRRSVLTDPAGDSSEIVFSRIQYGEIGNAELFRWKPGPGITVRDLGGATQGSE